MVQGEMSYRQVAKLALCEGSVGVSKAVFDCVPPTEGFVFGDREIQFTTRITTWARQHRRRCCYGLGMFFFELKTLHLHVLDDTVNAQRYRDHILQPLIVPHFDAQTLADRPTLMDENVKPYRALLVQEYLR